MKVQITILFLLTYLSSLGQIVDKAVVYGKVNLRINDIQLSELRGGISCKEYKNDSSWSSSTMFIDKNGFFKRSFPKNIKLILETNFYDFYKSDTIINIVSTDSIYVEFKISPKEYIYTKQIAERDISNGLVQLITFDTLIYEWDQKINFTKEFGFNYVLLEEPVDYEFEENMYNYNWHIYDYLYTINDSTWEEDLLSIEDSLIHIDADNYGKENDIDIKAIIFPKDAKLSKQMRKVIGEQKTEFERILTKDKEKYASYTPSFMLDKIDNSQNCDYIFIAEYWSASYFKEMIPELIKRLATQKEIGLINTSDLIIEERITSGELEEYGHGYVVSDDLFTIAGRANHLLKRVTGEDFGNVSMYSNDSDLKKLQNRWVYWLMNLKAE